VENRRVADVLAYFITFTTYGTWLHGRAPGSVDREHSVPGTPFLPPSMRLEQERRRAMRQDCYVLDAGRRAVVLSTVREVARHRGWTLWAAHVRGNHVHVVVSANHKPEKVMSDFKAWASRRLREAFGESPDRDRWTQHGSTRYLNSEESLAAAIAYVIDGQGDKLECFDGRSINDPDNEPDNDPDNEPDNEPEA
jgi:REP element-mobilizing transposase RayT